MRGRRRWLVVLVAAVVGSGVAISSRWSALAQDRGPGKEKGAAAVRPGPCSVQDAMIRPFDLPFAQETSLEDVRAALARGLDAPVVLDIAALDRLDLTPADTVRLDLKGVRLKVGLKLLLDQVGLSFRIVAEDNLLILTDPAESGDPAERTMAEIKELHRDLHDLQDAVDNLRDLVEEDLGFEPETRKDRTTVVRVGSRRPKAASPTARRGVRG